MNGWMFFPQGENAVRTGNINWELISGVFPGMNAISRKEWHAYIPESRERLQGHSLGFFCGGGRKNIPPDILPDYPMRTFVSDYVIMPSCWTDQFNQTVPAEGPEKYRIAPVPADFPVMTVTGFFPDRPPYRRVCGSYCFFPPPYRLRSGG